MRFLRGPIGQRLLPAIFVALAFAFWAVLSLALEDPEEQASQEVLARLQLSPAIKAQVDAIFAEYKGKIETGAKAVDEAYKNAADASFAVTTNKGSADAAQAAKKKWDDETKLYEAAVRERDAKVKQALPAAAAAKFARGMKLVAERNAKKNAVFEEEFASIRKAAQAGKPKDEAEVQKDIENNEKKVTAIDQEYGKKLDAAVGTVTEQK